MQDNNDRNLLKPAWRKFALRAQNLNRNNDNPAIIQMTVLVNADGTPLLWTEPKIISLEPRLDFDFTSLENKLTQEQLALLLNVIAEHS